MRSSARRIQADAELTKKESLRNLVLEHEENLADLEITKAKELNDIEVNKFEEMMKTIG